MARAFIVDDDTSFRLGLAAVLRLEGFVTAGAATCQEAVAELARGSVDLLFVDVNLPDGSGFDLLPRPEASAVIVVTAEPSLAIAERALALGACDCLAKPVDRVRIKMTLAVLARERTLREQIHQMREELAGVAGEGPGALNFLQATNRNALGPGALKRLRRR
jgi:two-component system NtrC family response regulator